jgi:hypothetical protein
VPGPAGDNGPVWKPTSNDLKLVLAASALSVALVVAGRSVLTKPRPAPSELETLPLDERSRLAVERALALEGIEVAGYDVLFDPMRASGIPRPPMVHDVHLMTKGCSGYRGHHPGCLLYMVEVNQQTQEVTISLDPGGK